MKRILYIILISILISNCSQKFRSTELKEYFNEPEIKDLANRNFDFKQYYEMIINAGEWEPMGLFQQRIYTKSEYYDLRDPSIQVLIAVQYLTQNDQQKRDEIWTEK